VTDSYAGLSSSERGRLERFAAEFEDVDPADYELFAGTTSSPEDVEAAQDAVNRLIGSGSRRAATKEAVRIFAAAADGAIGRRFRAVELLFGSRSFPSRPEDRARLLGSIERAVAAVILWDELTDDERATLAGPWSVVVDRALAAG
jgi:hypothetical protein